MSESIVIIPTYDERENVRPIAEAVFKACPTTLLLFVDDNSPDGTGRVIDELSAVDSRVHCIHNPGKGGLGRAYIMGFKWALARSCRFVIGMDADFSHDPVEIPHLLKAAENADLVIGSRYVNGIRITNWPLSRLILSRTAGTYIRLVTGMNIHDPTGGYRCFRREVLESIDLDTVLSNGYSFLVETAHRTWSRGFRITEVPITFEDRRAGYSKMNLDIFKESLWMVWKLLFLNGFRRRPQRRATSATT